MLAATRHPQNKTQAEEILRLMEAYCERCEQGAFERILALHHKLLHHLVRRSGAASGEPREDLLQVGYVGLVKAAEGYKVGSGAKFSSYAYATIEIE